MTAGRLGSRNGGWRMAAGKLSAFMAGRFTAFTVCGVITHSERSTGLPSLARFQWYSKSSERSALP